MIVIRPIRRKDLDALLGLSRLTSYGLTSLPPDREILRSRIRDSLQSFDKAVDRPGGETYLFAMEDLEKKAVAGISGIVSKVGGFQPFYAYRIKTVVHSSEALKIRKEIAILKLVREHDGPCEIGSLFLHPHYRGGPNGRLLSLARFLFMADHPALLDPVVIAELRGVINQGGRSPFWESLGRHFFDMDFPKADYLSMKDKSFIADLMPTYPVYINLLPKKAQAVIGEVHEQTRPAMQFLLKEGFKLSGMVDIFEGGPIVSCPREEIRTIRESRRMEIARVTGGKIRSDPFLISNGRQEFRACAAPLNLLPGQGIEIERSTARALKVKKGDAVRFARLWPGGRTRAENGGPRVAKDGA